MNSLSGTVKVYVEPDSSPTCAVSAAEAVPKLVPVMVTSSLLYTVLMGVTAVTSHWSKENMSFPVLPELCKETKLTSLQQSHTPTMGGAKSARMYRLRHFPANDYLTYDLIERPLLC